VRISKIKQVLQWKKKHPFRCELWKKNKNGLVSYLFHKGHNICRQHVFVLDNVFTAVLDDDVTRTADYNRYCPVVVVCLVLQSSIHDRPHQNGVLLHNAAQIFYASSCFKQTVPRFFTCNHNIIKVLL
jgi:hypothetical protein